MKQIWEFSIIECNIWSCFESTDAKVEFGILVKVWNKTKLSCSVWNVGGIRSAKSETKKTFWMKRPKSKYGCNSPECSELLHNLDVTLPFVFLIDIVFNSLEVVPRKSHVWVEQALGLFRLCECELLDEIFFGHSEKLVAGFGDFSVGHVSVENVCVGSLYNKWWKWL